MYFLPDTWMENSSSDPPNWGSLAVEKGFKVLLLNGTVKQKEKEEIAPGKVCRQPGLPCSLDVGGCHRNERSCLLETQQRESANKDSRAAWLPLAVPRWVCAGAEVSGFNFFMQIVLDLRASQAPGERKGVRMQELSNLLHALVWVQFSPFSTVVGCACHVFLTLKLGEIKCEFTARCSTRLVQHPKSHRFSFSVVAVFCWQ